MPLSPPSFSFLANTSGQFTSEQSRFRTGHNGKWAHKSAISESTGNAFFVKSQENTHAGTKDILSAQQETRDIMFLLHTYVPTY